jgi:hypothetical protein
MTQRTAVPMVDWPTAVRGRCSHHEMLAFSQVFTKDGVRLSQEKSVRIVWRSRTLMSIGATVFAFLSIACADATSPPKDTSGKIAAPNTVHYAQVAMVTYVYAMNLGTGDYGLQWRDTDLGGGGQGPATYTSLNTGAFVCDSACGNYDNPGSIPRAIDNSCDPILYPTTCLQPIQPQDSAFLMHGVDSLWADTTGMADTVKTMCQALINQFHHLRSVGHIYSGNNLVSDGTMGPHGGATIFISGYSDASTHVDQRFLDSTHVSNNPPYSRALVASILVHEAAHSLKYEHGKLPDLPANVPQDQRNNWSTWPFVITNYASPTGCVHYPQ